MPRLAGLTLVSGVVPGVPVQVDWPVVEIDDVDGGHAKFEKWYVVVLGGPRAIQEVSAVAQALGLSEHDITQTGC